MQEGVVAYKAAAEAATSEASRVISPVRVSCDQPIGFSTLTRNAIKASICLFKLSASFKTSSIF
ncbi:hypothetical protein LINGRAHAP2_LOCUS33660, partial [Linum grandiflorum]